MKEYCVIIVRKTDGLTHFETIFAGSKREARRKVEPKPGDVIEEIYGPL